MKNYTLTRKIYEHCYGPVPVDKDGRTYDIDHLDGDNANNHPTNLQALPLRKHFEKHWKLGEYGACYLIKIRMNHTPDELYKLRCLVQQERVKNGTHNFLGPTTNKRRVENGTHPWLGKNNPVHKVTTEERKRRGDLLRQMRLGKKRGPYKKKAKE